MIICLYPGSEDLGFLREITWIDFYMITEYELYSDERYQDSSSLLLGGVICTEQRRAILESALRKVRSEAILTHEMRWAKISKKYLDAYKAWIDVFFDDPYPRFSLLRVNLSDHYGDRSVPGTTAGQQRMTNWHLFSINSCLYLSAHCEDTKRWSV